MNEIMSNEQIQETLGQVANTMSAMGTNMETISANMASMNRTLLSQEEKIERNHKEFINFKSYVEDREQIAPVQVEQITDTIKSRVAEILTFYDRFDLFGKFSSKCRWDSRKHGYVGNAGIYTRVADFDDLIRYIKKWNPVWKDGSAGYISHLDELAESKRVAS